MLVGDARRHARYARSVLERAREQKVHHLFRMIGHFQDIPAALATAELIVVPAVKPPLFGRVVAEAQAMARPVVASEIGAFPENLLAPPRVSKDLRTGWLVPPNEPLTLAEAIEEALALDDIRLSRARGAGAGIRLLRLFPTPRCRCDACGLYIGVGRGRLTRLRQAVSSRRPSVVIGFPRTAIGAPPGRSRGSVVIDRSSAARISTDFRPLAGPPAADNDADPPDSLEAQFRSCPAGRSTQRLDRGADPAGRGGGCRHRRSRAHSRDRRPQADRGVARRPHGGRNRRRRWPIRLHRRHQSKPGGHAAQRSGARAPRAQAQLRPHPCPRPSRRPGALIWRRVSPACHS